MDWVWTLYERHVMRELQRGPSRPPGDDDVERGPSRPPGDDEVERAFLAALSDSTVTILVQEPWRGSVRFKRLAVLDASDCTDLLRAPEETLRSRYGGGKFKLNFHRGRHFVATRNFKPQGEPLWPALPEMSTDLAP